MASRSSSTPNCSALQAYNQRIYAEKQSALIDLESCEEPAADLTAYGIEDEIIGVLEIPAMELTMPVYLGAYDDHLAAGAAVLVTPLHLSAVPTPTASLPVTGAGKARITSGI